MPLIPDRIVRREDFTEIWKLIKSFSAYRSPLEEASAEKRFRNSSSLSGFSSVSSDISISSTFSSIAGPSSPAITLSEVSFSKREGRIFPKPAGASAADAKDTSGLSSMPRVDKISPSAGTSSIPSFKRSIYSKGTNQRGELAQRRTWPAMISSEMSITLYPRRPP